MSDDDEITVSNLNQRIAELEEEVKHLKRELAARPLSAGPRPFTPDEGEVFRVPRPYSKETQAGRKKKQK